jgi:23S rRNA pseudouridine2605 synthase
MSALKGSPEDGKPDGDRIAKVIARSGLCSRRDAELLIGEKRVSVNGSLIESAALDVTSADAILVDGQPLASPEPPRLWRYHKPKGRVTTHKDPEGRPTVFEALPENLPRLISVGRLDFNTEGLLLLTNDGDLARHLELPSTGWLRRYRVRAYGDIDQGRLSALSGGLRADGVSYGPIEATLEREQGDNVWITIAIREGKNREVRSILEHLGLTVNRLIRVSFGPFILGDLEPGQVEEVKTSVLKDQLGPRLTRQLGVKRELPREERRLPPSRSKPTYLRRKPDAPERPQRQEEQRPMRRRRILGIDGGEATIELTPEKRRGPDDRFSERPRGERPSFRSREDRPPREDGGRFERGEQKPWSKKPEGGENGAAPRAEGARFRKGPDRFSDKPRGDRPAFRSREDRPPREDGRRFERGEHKPWSKKPEGEGGESAPRAEGAHFRKGPDRFSDKPRGDRPAFRSREDRPPREDGRRFERGEHKPWSKKPEGEGVESAPRAEGARSRGGSDRFSDKPRGDRPPFRSREDRPPREDRKSFDRGERKPWSKKPEGVGGESAPQAEGAPFQKRPERFSDRPKGERPPFRSREDRPPREGGERGQRPGGERRFGDRPKREAGAEADRPVRRDGARDGAERRSFKPRGKPEGDRPQWKPRSEAAGEERPRWTPRTDASEERPRSQFRKAEGEGRPFRKEGGDGEKRPYRARSEGAPQRKRDEGGERGKTFTKGGFKGPKREGPGGAKGGKPFKRREGPGDRPRPSGPRKPTPRPSGETS